MMIKRIAILIVALLGGVAVAQSPAKKSAEGTALAVDNEIFTVVEQDPEFDGGMEALTPWLGSHVIYPTEAKEQRLEGTVYVTFVVEKDGSISNVRVLNHREEMGTLEAEAVRVVRTMPKWKSGRQRGKKVRVQFTLPIVFKL